MPNPAFVGSAKNRITSSATLVIPYVAGIGNTLMLGITIPNVPVGVDSVTDDGGNTWSAHVQFSESPSVENPTPAGGYNFEFWYCTNSQPTTNITIVLTGSADYINGIVGEYSNFSPNATQNIQDSHAAKSSEWSQTQSDSALASFYVCYGPSAPFLGPDIGGIERQNAGPEADLSVLSLADNMTGGITSETVDTPSVAFSTFGFYAAVTPPPCDVEPNPGTLTFEAVAGGANPSPQNVSIANLGGGGAIPFTYSSDSAWLIASGAGTTDQDISIAVDITGLSPGDYTGIVTVNTDTCGNPQIAVNLTITPAPVVERADCTFVSTSPTSIQPSNDMPTVPDPAGPQTWVYDFGTHGWFQLQRGFTSLSVFEIGEGEQILVGGAENGLVYVIDDLNGTFDFSGECPAASFRPALIDFGDPSSMRVFKYLELEFTNDAMAGDITVTYWLDPPNVDNPGTGKTLTLAKVRGADRYRGWPQGGSLCQRLLLDISIAASTNTGAIRGAKIVADKVLGLTT